MRQTLESRLAGGEGRDVARSDGRPPLLAVQGARRPLLPVARMIGAAGSSRESSRWGRPQGDRRAGWPFQPKGEILLQICCKCSNGRSLVQPFIASATTQGAGWSRAGAHPCYSYGSPPIVVMIAERPRARSRARRRRIQIDGTTGNSSVRSLGAKFVRRL